VSKGDIIPWRKSFRQFIEFSMEFHKIFQKHLTDFFIIFFHGIPWNYETEVDGIPWNPMENSMEFCQLTEFEGIRF
jgi:hypothetical protein